MQLPTNDAILAQLGQKPSTTAQPNPKSGDASVSPSDFISSIPEGTKKTGQQIVDILQKLGQSSMRGYAAAAPYVFPQLAGPGGLLNRGNPKPLTLTPDTQFQKDLFGTDKEITPTSFGNEALPGEFNVGGGHTFNAKNIPLIAPFLGVALGVADAIPGESITKTAAVTALKSVRGDVEAASVLSAVTGMSKTVARRVAPDILKAGGDEMKIRAVVEGAVAESQNVARLAERAAQKIGLKPKPVEDAAALSREPLPPSAPAMSETETRTYVKDNFENLKPAYQQEIKKAYGSDNVISADEAKKVIPGYSAEHAQIYHEASSDFAKKQYAEWLPQRQGQKNNTVLFTGGATGVGKSTALKNVGTKIEDFPIVYDTNLTGSGAINKVQAALDHGYDVLINVTHRDPMESFVHGVIPRVSKENRIMAVNEHVSRHMEYANQGQGAPAVNAIESNFKQYIDDGRLKISHIDNSRGRGQAVLADSVDNIPKFDYNYLHERVTQATEEARQSGKITEAQASGILGKTDRANAGRQLEQADKGKVTITDKIPKPRTLTETMARNATLVRKISEEKMSGPVKDIIRPHFPTLTDKTLFAFSKRLAQLKRPSDIEALLASMQRLENQADETGQRILDAAMPVSVRSALTPRQAQLTVDQLTREIKTPENAALAEAEYNTLWEHADQSVIDRFNEANVERGILEEVLQDHPAADLAKARLPGTAHGDNSLAELQRMGERTGGKNRLLDQLASERGYEDLNHAQEGLDDFHGIRQQLSDLKNEIAELRPKVRSAQIVRSLLDELPVVENGKIAAIDHLANSADIRHYRDISGFSGGFRDMYRNFEHFFRGRFDDVKKAVLDPFDEAKGRYVDLYNKMGDEIGRNIVEKFGIKRGSVESAAVQDWGERDLMTNPATANPDSVYHTRDALIAKFGEKRAQDIMAADEWFRNKYNEVITQINDVRKKIYPNNPSKLIPFRRDYYRHYNELGSGFMDAVRNFMDVPSGIDPKLVGVSEFTKPRSKFLGLALQRKGPQSTRDAVGGFLDYAPSAAYAIQIDPQIGVFRYLRRKLAEAAPISGTQDHGAAYGMKNQGIDNMLQFLDDFSNNLATKTNPVDRWIQKRIPGGRAAIKAVDWANNRIKANTILGNLGSTFSQMANIPLGFAHAKQYAIPGVARTLASLFVKNTVLEHSTFLKERYIHKLKDRFPLDFWTHPVQAGTEAVARRAATLLEAGDMIGTHFIWNSNYSKAVGQGVKDPVKYADYWTRKLVAGRGIGELPVDQQAKITQMLAPFTVEVQNLWWVMKDQVKAKDFAGLAILLFANYLFNEASDKTRGQRVVYDPINALVEGGASLQREVKAGNPGRGALEFAGRQLGEVATNVPGGQLVTSNLPDSMFGMKKTDFFGQGDPNRYGSPILFAGALQNPGWRLLPPFGGAQLQKTYKGVRALLSGEAKTGTGKTSFPVAWTPENFVRAIAWGPNGTSEASKSYKLNDDIHQRLAEQDVATAKVTDQAETKWAELKALRASSGKEAVAAEWSKIAKENPDLLKKMDAIAKEEAKGLTSTDRLVLMLNVGNGERARYVVDQIHSLKTKEEKQQLWTDYAKKKIITKEVAKQVADLLSKEGN